MSRIVVTGAAGFIGYHVARDLLSRGDAVLGFDNLNDYYDISLKEARLANLEGDPGFTFVRGDLADRAAVAALFSEWKPDSVVHLGAQAGVRYSLEHPEAYIDSNLVGFGAILEGCRHNPVQHLVYASSSSVYGENAKIPFSEDDNVDHPISLYAATKKANEVMAHSYSHLYGIPTTGLRFFTVYGPWGRPDMATFSFTKAVFEGRPINVYNHGKMRRDFTYVDDVSNGVILTLDRPPGANAGGSEAAESPGRSSAPFRVYNIGNNQPVELGYFIDLVERLVGKPAIRNLLPMQPGDVPVTYADTSALERATGFRPSTSIEDGMSRFIAWYRAYYHL